VCSTGLTPSSISLWPFPAIAFVFLMCFNDTRFGHYYFEVLTVTAVTVVVILQSCLRIIRMSTTLIESMLLSHLLIDWNWNELGYSTAMNENQRINPNLNWHRRIYSISLRITTSETIYKIYDHATAMTNCRLNS
jgi:uncharacterized membrane protein YkgB